MAGSGHASTVASEWQDRVGWGLVALLVGVVALASDPIGYAAVAGVGLAMLGLSLVQLRASHELDVLTSVLGATAVAAGLGALVGVRVDVFALFFIILGLVLIGLPVARSFARAR